jgi:hypothetical protein
MNKLNIILNVLSVVINSIFSVLVVKTALDITNSIFIACVCLVAFQGWSYLVSGVIDKYFKKHE